MSMELQNRIRLIGETKDEKNYWLYAYRLKRAKNKIHEIIILFSQGKLCVDDKTAATINGIRWTDW